MAIVCWVFLHAFLSWRISEFFLLLGYLLLNCCFTCFKLGLQFGSLLLGLFDCLDVFSVFIYCWIFSGFFFGETLFLCCSFFCFFGFIGSSFSRFHFGDILFIWAQKLSGSLSDCCCLVDVGSSGGLWLGNSFLWSGSFGFCLCLRLCICLSLCFCCSLVFSSSTLCGCRLFSYFSCCLRSFSLSFFSLSSGLSCRCLFDRSLFSFSCWLFLSWSFCCLLILLHQVFVIKKT